MYSFMTANVHKVAGTKGLRIRASASHDSTELGSGLAVFVGFAPVAVQREFLRKGTPSTVSRKSRQAEISECYCGSGFMYSK